MKKTSIFIVALLAVIAPFHQKLAHAAANIDLTSGVMYTTSSNTLQYKINLAIASVDYTKWHVDVNGGGVSPMNPTSATIDDGSGPSYITFTFAGTPFSDPGIQYDAAHGFYADAAALTDFSSNTNIVLAHTSSQPIIDGQAPSLTSVSISSDNAINSAFAKVGDTVTITFTANEPLDGSLATVSVEGNDVTSSGVNTSGNTWQYSYVMQSGDSPGAVTFKLYTMDITQGNENVADPITDTTDSSSVTFDETSPTLFEIIPVPTPSTDTTPSYMFNSDDIGTITYGGDCTSSTTTTGFGPNTITFERFHPGVHSSCTITLTDRAGNVSNTLTVSSFTITPTAASTDEGAGAGYTTNPNDIPGTEHVVTPTTPSPTPSTCAPFMSSYLRKGNRNDQVATLQQFLKDQGFFTYPTVTGFFSTFTEAAVKAFQTKYAADILTPQQLTQPTGLVLGFTLKKINEVSCAR